MPRPIYVCAAHIASLLTALTRTPAVAQAPATPAPLRAAAQAVPSPTPQTVAPKTAPAPVRARLTVSQAVANAQAQSPIIAAARKNVEVSVAQLNQAYSTYYPNLSLSSSYQHAYSESTVTVNGNSVDPSTGSLVFSKSNKTQASSRDTITGSTSLTQTLYDFGQRTLQVRAAEQNVAALKNQLAGKRNDVTLNVRQQFFSAFVNQVLVKINEQAVASNTEHVRQAEELYRAGTKARVDITMAQANLATARFNLVKAQGALRTAWVNLNVAMGAPRDTPYDLDLEQTDDVPVSLDTPRLLQIALARRPDLLALLAQMRATLCTLELQYRLNLPVFSASVSYGYTGVPSPLDVFWNGGVSLRWSVFNGFLTHYQASQYRAQAESQALQLENLRLTVFGQVENDCIAFEQARIAVDTAQVGVTNAQENYRLARERYAVGLGSSVDFIDAQTTLTQAQSNLATAQSDLRTARAQLERDTAVESIKDLPPPASPIVPERIPGSTLKLPDVPTPRPDSATNLQERRP